MTVLELVRGFLVLFEILTYTIKSIQKCVEAKCVSVQLIRLNNEIIHIIKCDFLRIDNGIRELKIESDFSTS